MKKSIVFLFFFFSLIVVSQTRQQTKQVRALDQEISRLKLDKIRLERQIQPNYAEEIKRLSCEIDSLAKMSLEGLTLPEIAKMEQETNKKRDLLALYKEKALGAEQNAWFQEQAQAKDQEISFLEEQRKLIFVEYTTDHNVPKEMAKWEQRRRQNATVVRREEMVTGKIERSLINPGQADTIGQLVIFMNDNYNDVFLQVRPLDGGEEFSIALKAKTTEKRFLIPGNYLVTGTLAGVKNLNSKILKIDGQMVNVFGQECDDYVLVTSGAW